MTQKSLDVLSQNPNAFFVMVEGSLVDLGAHNNDPAAVVSEYLAFDKAVEVAVDFASKRYDTMVLVVEDHATGGITIGSNATDTTYGSFLLKDTIAPLTNAKITSNVVIELLKDGKPVEEVLALYGIENPSKKEIKWFKDLEPDVGLATSPSRIKLGQMLSKLCNIGWTTLGHTGEDVVLYSYLPDDKRITGLIENTDIPEIIAKNWGAELTSEVCLHN